MISQVAGGGAAALAPPPSEDPGGGRRRLGVPTCARRPATTSPAASPLDGLSWQLAGRAGGARWRWRGLERACGLRPQQGIRPQQPARGRRRSLPRLRDPIALQQHQQLQMEAQRRVSPTPGNITRSGSLLAASGRFTGSPRAERAGRHVPAAQNAQEVPRLPAGDRPDQRAGVPGASARSMQASAQAVMVRRRGRRRPARLSGRLPAARRAI